MTPHDEGWSSAGDGLGLSRKRAYVPPKLERLGTVRELTQGVGTLANFDASHPPGHNKSKIA